MNGRSLSTRSWCERSSGSKLWDVDGNEYVDLVNGFGGTAFGHGPEFVVDAVRAQLERGFPIGPQADLAGEVAQLITELTGNERATFCNTGSEAVMAAMRIARTVTGREKIVIFTGDYHGQFDEVLVKGVQHAGAAPRSAGGAGHPARLRAEHDRARLRHARDACSGCASTSTNSRRWWSSRCRAGTRACSRSSSCASCARSPRPAGTAFDVR